MTQKIKPWYSIRYTSWTFKELSPPLPNSVQNHGPNVPKIIQNVLQTAGIQLVTLKSFWKAPICLGSIPRSFQYNTHTHWGYDLESMEERGVWKRGKGDCHQTSPQPTDWIRNYVRNAQCFTGLAGLFPRAGVPSPHLETSLPTPFCGMSQGSHQTFLSTLFCSAYAVNCGNTNMITPVLVRRFHNSLGTF